MLGVWIAVVAALAGLVMVAAFAVSLWHRAVALARAVGVIMGQVEAALALVDQVGGGTSYTVRVPGNTRE